MNGVLPMPWASCVWLSRQSRTCFRFTCCWESAIAGRTIRKRPERSSLRPSTRIPPRPNRITCSPRSTVSSKIPKRALGNSPSLRSFRNPPVTKFKTTTPMKSRSSAFIRKPAMKQQPLHVPARLVLVIALLLASAPRVSSQQAAVSSPAAAQPKLTDVTSAIGLHFQHVASHTSRKYLIETMGSGVALFDYDNDGRLDIFIVNGAPLADPTPKGTIPQKQRPKDWNRLYHQKPDGTFEDATEKAGLHGAGYGMGVAVGDYDNDGYEDLYVTAYCNNTLYHNNGNGTFTEVTALAGAGGGGWSTSAAWGGRESDGRLRLRV